MIYLTVQQRSHLLLNSALLSHFSPVTAKHFNVFKNFCSPGLFNGNGHPLVSIGQETAEWCDALVPCNQGSTAVAIALWGQTASSQAAWLVFLLCMLLLVNLVRFKNKWRCVCRQKPNAEIITCCHIIITNRDE